MAVRAPDPLSTFWTKGRHSQQRGTLLRSYHPYTDSQHPTQELLPPRRPVPAIAAPRVQCFSRACLPQSLGMPHCGGRESLPEGQIRNRVLSGAGHILSSAGVCLNSQGLPSQNQVSEQQPGTGKRRGGPGGSGPASPWRPCSPHTCPGSGVLRGLLPCPPRTHTNKV